MTELLVKLFIKDNQNTNSPEVRRKYGYLSGVTGIALNVLLFAGKLTAGILTGSIAVTADAFNNLSDASSSIVTLAGFRMAGTPADSEHPFGHGRIEYLAGLTISMLIILMGFELGKSSVEKIITPEENTFSIISVVILIVSIAIKLWLCFFNRKLGKLINSASMKATAMDSLSDCAATSAVLAGLFISEFAGINIDGWAGLAVALFIGYTGFSTAKESVSSIVGKKPDPELVRDIYDTVLSYENIVGVHDLIVHDYGVGIIIVSLHAEMPHDMNFMSAHELIDVVEDDLKIKYNCIATIHMDPVVMNDIETNDMKEKITKIVHAIDGNITIHDFRFIKDGTQKNLVFDIVVPYRFRMSDEEIKDSISLAVSAIDENLTAVINVDKKMS